MSAVLVAEHPAGRHDVLRLVAEEAARTHIRLHLGHVSLREGLERREAREQRGRDLIDARVRALRRKAHRDHQLVVLPIVQRAQRVRIPLPQRRNDRRDLFLHADPSVSFAAIIA